MSDVISCPACEKYFDATFDVDSCPRCGVSFDAQQLELARQRKVEPLGSSSPLNWIGVIICAGFYLVTVGNPFRDLLRGGDAAFLIGSFLGRLAGIAILFGPAAIIARRYSKIERFHNSWGGIFLGVFFAELFAVLILVLVVVGLFGGFR